MQGNAKNKIQQINTALNNAVSFINIARNLIKELESESGSISSNLQPGTFGKYVGDGMVTDDGQRYEVPENYASKSVLVYGDKLKMYDEAGVHKFKQVERVKRFRTEGVLAKKEGKWHVVTSDGSYRVLDSAVSHFGGVEGDQCVVLLPLEDKYVPFAAMESVLGKELPKVLEMSPDPKPVVAEGEVDKASKISQVALSSRMSSGEIRDPDRNPVESKSPVVIQIPPKVERVIVNAPLGSVSNKNRPRKRKKSTVPMSTPVTVVARPVKVPEEVKGPDLPKVLTDEDLR